MRAFLPELMFAFNLMRGSKVLKLVQEPIAILGLEMLNEPARGVPLKVRQDA